MLVWTLLPDHATRHSFPLFPGITGLAAMTWYVLMSGGLNVHWERRLGKLALGTLALFGAAAVVALALLGCAMGGVNVSWGKFSAAQFLPPGVWWLVPIIAGSVVWSAAAGWRAYKEHRWGGLLAALIVSWVMLKIAFVQIYIPDRNDSRQPRAKAEMLAHLVPEGATLYLDQLKDEGIMFYYRRPVLRLRSWDKLPIGHELVYCIMTSYEREQLKKRDNWLIVDERQLQDAQGDPMFYLALRLGEAPVRQARADFEH
jgi:hypothetical protein